MENQMLIRSWRAIAGARKILNTYADHLQKNTFVEMAQLPGHLGATLAHKTDSSECELIVMSFWKDKNAADQFSSTTSNDAVVKPGTQKLLKSFDLKVEYFETLVSTGIVNQDSNT